MRPPLLDFFVAVCVGDLCGLFYCDSCVALIRAAVGLICWGMIRGGIFASFQSRALMELDSSVSLARNWGFVLVSERRVEFKFLG